MADVALCTMDKVLKHNPKNPNWIDRDRFYSSAGHGSMFEFIVYFLTGYDVSMEDFKDFRQTGSKTHLDILNMEWQPGVETTSGPLGQGFDWSWKWQWKKNHAKLGTFNKAGMRL